MQLCFVSGHRSQKEAEAAFEGQSSSEGGTMKITLAAAADFV